MEKQTTYKAFDKDLKCKDFQFEVGKEFQHTGDIKVCSSGFHSCVNPFDVFNYYPLIESRFAEVEIWGKTDNNSEDSKIASEFIFIKKELSEKEMNLVCVNYLIKDCELKGGSQSGDSSQQSQSGYYSKQSQSGYSSKQSQSGYFGKQCSCGNDSEIESKGNNNVAAAIGVNSKIKGIKGTWITLAEYDWRGICICVLSGQIDGGKIKENVFYKLIEGKFTEVK